MSISPLPLTDQAHLAPFAVLSMHMPTAVLPSVAIAGVGIATTIAAVMVANPMPMAQVVCFKQTRNISLLLSRCFACVAKFNLGSQGGGIGIEGVAYAALIAMLSATSAMTAIIKRVRFITSSS